LPVVPPTPARVNAMLAAHGFNGAGVLCDLPPLFAPVTWQDIAINAVMAGCLPAYLSVIGAAVEGIAAAEFNLVGVATTTGSAAPMIIVNGPIVQQIGLNAGGNVFGPGHRANATIGRALTLVLRNVGGAIPGELDMSTIGQPAKYSCCIAENETDSPWAPLHVERGFRREQSTVTVVGAEGTMNMHSYGKHADDILRVFADTMMHGPSNEYVHGGEPWIVLSPEHAEILHDAGYSKADVQQKLWEWSKMQAGRMTPEDMGRAQASRTAAYGPINADTVLTIAHTPQDIAIIVAGGAGAHTVYIPCFGNTRSVTRAIE
jgi:hypothetical protein